ncbi:uncharacterized protein BDZ99DRAFT_443628 [Mytilinidion resinicola]|uniref:Cupin type-2 domain-containing protein n=1 Tax=Mytilinidion resinicola TaxID=574789 RepID=A0A6A6YNF1_9PEZI|nr:uncharacterized protein BDZ99DRAFT_443628 [Mytilinidion resinicola]KAF2809387.1 hypothetical protein BDZ99DRAFT_443628 [Mytilinidion resinicola]
MVHYITTHNATGAAIFSPKVPSQTPKIPIPIGEIQILSSTHSFPANLSTESDIEQYQQDRLQPFFAGLRRICPENGSATCMISMDAGAESTFHRTMTLETVVVIEGEMEMELDSGEKRLLKVGDSLVQRATAHKARNVTPNGGRAKWVAFIQSVEEPLRIGDKELGGEWAH